VISDAASTAKAKLNLQLMTVREQIGLHMMMTMITADIFHKH